MTSARRRRIEVEYVQGVFVVRFIDRTITDESNIQTIGAQLFELVDDLGYKKIVIDFTGVTLFYAQAIGKLISLNKKARDAECRLALCSVCPGVYEVFEVTRLNKVFEICGDLNEALKSLQSEPAYA